MGARLLIFVAAIGLLSAARAGAAPLGTPAGPEAATAANSAPPQEVTVTAQRHELEERVSSFVDGITTRANNEGLARWHAPICPLVTGLPREQGEFVLGRVSEIARAAGVPLAGEKCTANLFIFVTNEPKQLLQAMEDKYFAVAFGNAAPSEVDDFIQTARPVRIWRGSYRTPAAGEAAVLGPPPSAQILGGGMASAPMYTVSGAVAAHLTYNFVWTFGSVYVIADQTQLRGVSQRQFADYIAMMSFAEIKTAAHLGDVQTILKLFEGAPAAAPQGLSDWDQAFLKSLYATEQNVTLQRTLITKSMARELVP